MRKIFPADTLTPILAYMRVQGEHKVILESIPREKENARFSIVAYNPVLVRFLKIRLGHLICISSSMSLI